MWASSGFQCGIHEFESGGNSDSESVQSVLDFLSSDFLGFLIYIYMWNYKVENFTLACLFLLLTLP